MGKYKKLLKRIEKHLQINTEVTVSKTESFEIQEISDEIEIMGISCTELELYKNKKPFLTLSFDEELQNIEKAKIIAENIINAMHRTNNT